MNIFTKKRILAFVFFAIVLALFISIKKYNINPDNVVDYLQEHTKISWLVFVAFYTVMVMIPTIPIIPFIIAAGIFFSFKIGLILAMIGTITGAMFSFIISRYLFHDYFHKQLSHTKYFKWTKIKDQNKLTKLVLISRLTPFIPFNLANYVLAMTKIRTNNYFIATLIGVFPAVFALVFIGEKLNEIATIELILATLILCIIALGAYFYKTKLKKS